MRSISEASWPRFGLSDERLRTEVWISKSFIAQVFVEEDGNIRISINRATKSPDGRWVDGITWDELQDVKGQIGRSQCAAYEVFPAEADVINVANMRHLWIPKEPLDFGWRREKP